MTEAKQGKPRNLIPKPVSQAFLAGASIGTISLAMSLKNNVPGDQAFQSATILFLAGVGLSFGFSWNDSRLEAKPRKRNRDKAISFSSLQGTKNIYRDELEYSVAQGGILVRESYFQALKHKISGNPRPRQMNPIESMERPASLDEFIFYSHYKGQLVQLQAKHVKLFLSSAWRNRANGVGLSQRHWERRRSQRPNWYKELHPLWFRAMWMLLWNTQKYLNRQLVITLNNQQSFLVVEPHELFIYLKWYECEKGKK